MKTFIILLCSAGVATAQTPSVNTNTGTTPANTPYAVIGQGANQRVWQRTTYETGPSGQAIPHIHRYTELSTGLNHLVNAQWVASTEEIDISADGNSALATNGQHQAYFPGNIYSGEIELATPDGKQLYSQPEALSYFDGTNSVLIAALTNATGEILPSGNQVIYTNAFAGLDADLLYTYTKAGFEQDVILREQPPDPGSLGLNPQTTRLQVLTEFFNPPQPGITANQLPTQAGMTLSDEELNFGVMQMVLGRAFLIGANTPSALVDKQWEMVEGHPFLVEEVPIESIASEIDTLPQFVAKTGAGMTKLVLSKGLIVPPQRLSGTATGKTPFLTQAKPPPGRGLVLDYQTINGFVTNFTFQGDTTYYLSGNLELFGTNTFEGGAVIKYTNGASMGWYDSSYPIVINWLGTAYRPVVLTAVDDNSVGEAIGSGSPTGYYANPALEIISSSVTITNFRIAYAQQAIYMVGISSAFYDGQILNCQNGFYAEEGAYGELRNVLFSDVQTNFNQIYAASFDLENCTFNSSAYLSTMLNVPYQSVVLTFTNCIVANVTNIQSVYSYTNFGTYEVTGGYNGFYECQEFGANAVTNSSYPFQTVGGGSYYLTNGCAFTNWGTTNIDPVLLADLGRKTVYPPMVYSNAIITNNLTLYPQAQRDTNSSPALGYHYDPLDHVFGGSDLYTNLTLSPGTAVGWFEELGSAPSSGEPYGISLNDGANLTSRGTVTDPCWIVQTITVQEGNGNWTNSGWMGGIVFTDGGSGATPQLDCQFTKWSTLSGGGNHFLDDVAEGLGTFADCEFYNGGILSFWPLLQFTNCLFFRIDFNGVDYAGVDNYTFLNCGFEEGLLELNRISSQTSSFWTIKNTAFDGTAFSTSDYFNGSSNYTAFDYNAYNWAVSTNTLEVVGLHDLRTNFDSWQSSWFGNYYQATNSPLIGMGSTNANLLGLYHFTVTTNQVIEGTNIVSIGYHYVATDQYGNPLDTNGDGIPDYLEDANGDGIFDAGDLGDWQISPFGLGGGNALQVFTPLKP